MGRPSKFIFGAVLGAVAAALITPVAGKKARTRLKQAAQKAGVDTKKLDKQIGGIIEKGGQLLREVKQSGEKETEPDKTKTKK
jgi:gas vesicle protein